MDRKGLAAILIFVQSAGVVPEVNLRNPLCAGEEVCKRWIHPGFEIKDRHHQNSKTGVSVVPRKGLMSHPKKNFEKMLILFKYCLHLHLHLCVPPELYTLDMVVGAQFIYHCVSPKAHGAQISSCSQEHCHACAVTIFNSQHQRCVLPTPCGLFTRASTLSKISIQVKINLQNK